MTREQLDALEVWIEAIIDDKDRASDGSDYLRRMRLKEDVEQAFDLTK